MQNNFIFVEKGLSLVYTIMGVSCLKNIKLFLLDMDGTIYLDDKLIDGAKDFIDTLKNAGKQFVFLTNNSSKGAKDYLDKLNALGIACTAENIFTSGMAMGIFLQGKNIKTIYLVGTKALKAELELFSLDVRTEIKEEDEIYPLIVGFDRELTYQKLEDACFLLDKGALFYATNCDVVCPIKDGKFIHDCASICKMLENATKRIPQFIGKPEPFMVRS